MSHNDSVPWYTWVFSGVGAAIVAPMIGWLVRRVPRKSHPDREGDDVGHSADGSPLADPTRSLGHDDRVGHGTAVAVPDGSASEQPAPDSARLVDALLVIPGMRDPDFRRSVYGHLPTVVSDQLQMDKRARIELINLIDTFGQYQHIKPWSAMLRRLDEMLPEHPAVQNLANCLTELKLL